MLNVECAQEPTTFCLRWPKFNTVCVLSAAPVSLLLCTVLWLLVWCGKSKSKIVNGSYSGPSRTHTFCHSLQPWAHRQPAARPMCAASCSF